MLGQESAFREEVDLIFEPFFIGERLDLLHKLVLCDAMEGVLDPGSNTALTLRTTTVDETTTTSPSSPFSNVLRLNIVRKIDVLGSGDNLLVVNAHFVRGVLVVGHVHITLRSAMITQREEGGEGGGTGVPKEACRPSRFPFYLPRLQTMLRIQARANKRQVGGHTGS
jgi:hypothetical protein